MMDEEDGVINRRSRKNDNNSGEQQRLLEEMGDSQEDLHL